MENLERRNLHGSFFFPSGVVHGCLLMSFPEAGVERERERLGWRLERERGSGQVLFGGQGSVLMMAEHSAEGSNGMVDFASRDLCNWVTYFALLARNDALFSLFSGESCSDFLVRGLFFRYLVVH